MTIVGARASANLNVPPSDLSSNWNAQHSSAKSTAIGGLTVGNGVPPRLEELDELELDELELDDGCCPTSSSAISSATIFETTFSVFRSRVAISAASWSVVSCRRDAWMAAVVRQPRKSKTRVCEYVGGVRDYVPKYGGSSHSVHLESRKETLATGALVNCR